MRADALDPEGKRGVGRPVSEQAIEVEAPVLDHLVAGGPGAGTVSCELISRTFAL